MIYFGSNFLPSFRHLICLFLGLVFFTTSCENEILKPVPAVSWELVKNYRDTDDKDKHELKITLTNNSAIDMQDNWALYWNQAPRSFLEITPAEKIHIRHHNGDFYEMKPVKGFELKAGASVSFKVICNVWLIKEVDTPLGMYIVFDEDDQQTIKMIDDYTLVPFTKEEQITRSEGDFHEIPTPEKIFAKNQRLTKLKTDDLYPIIPFPKHLEKGASKYQFAPGTINCHLPLSSELSNLIMQVLTKRGMNLTKVENSENAAISVSIDESVAHEEGYEILIDKDKGVEIKAQSEAGVLYGIYSLSSLIEKDDDKIFAKEVFIKDEPSYIYRGFHIDVARNFQDIPTLKRLIDLLSRYKINKLLLYLTEDEAWRLDIEELPELAAIGSMRGHTLDDKDHLQPSYGSGPFKDKTTDGSGHYMRSEYIELLKYAKLRNVEIIPEVNMPGHARAAIKAMEYRYRKFKEAGDLEKALEYRLIDPDDTSKYLSAQHYTDNVICVCQDAPYRFLETVLDDIIEMHDEAGVPLEFFHIGGDEVPRGAWTESPICAEYFKQGKGVTSALNLQNHFMNRIMPILQERNLKTGAWEEALMIFNEDRSWKPSPEFIGKDMYPYIWQNVWGNEDLGYRFMNEDYPVILCNVTHFYFDLAYDKDPREPGLYWGGFTNTEDPFSFIPNDILLSTTEDPMGRKYDYNTDFKKSQKLKEGKLKNIVGISAQLWGETLKGREMLEYYTLPKLFGFAQRVWEGQPAWGDIKDPKLRTASYEKDWNRFANTLGQIEFEKLNGLHGDFHYRLPAPGMVQSDSLFMNSSLPGLEIRYTIDGSIPNKNSKVYEGPIKLSEGTKVQAITIQGSRTSLHSTLTIKDKPYAN